jgi:hypothetical protein
VIIGIFRGIPKFAFIYSRVYREAPTDFQLSPGWETMSETSKKDHHAQEQAMFLILQGSRPISTTVGTVLQVKCQIRVSFNDATNCLGR